MKFRKKPVVIDAWKWDGDIVTLAELEDIIDQPLEADMTQDSKPIFIETLEGKMRADIGDWIIKGVKGEFYPIKNEIFKETYEKVD